MTSLSFVPDDVNNINGGVTVTIRLDGSQDIINFYHSVLLNVDKENACQITGANPFNDMKPYRAGYVTGWSLMSQVTAMMKALTAVKNIL